MYRFAQHPYEPLYDIIIKCRIKIGYVCYRFAQHPYEPLYDIIIKCRIKIGYVCIASLNIHMSHYMAPKAGGKIISFNNTVS